MIKDELDCAGVKVKESLCPGECSENCTALLAAESKVEFTVDELES